MNADPWLGDGWANSGPGWLPLAGLAFLAAALGLWHVGVRHYRSTGS
jgi:hypothetical protein